MADAEERVVYVKMGRRGLIEREAVTAADRVQMEGTGWMRRDDPAAPKGTPITEVTSTANSAEVPTSFAAFAAAESQAATNTSSKTSKK